MVIPLGYSCLKNKRITANYLVNIQSAQRFYRVDFGSAPTDSPPKAGATDFAGEGSAKTECRPTPWPDNYLVTQFVWQTQEMNCLL